MEILGQQNHLKMPVLDADPPHPRLVRSIILGRSLVLAYLLKTHRWFQCAARVKNNWERSRKMYTSILSFKKRTISINKWITEKFQTDDGKLLLSFVSRDTWLQTMGHHSGPMKLREVFVKLIVMMMMISAT